MKAIRPNVIVNFAITADGKVSTRKRTPSGFTSPTDKNRLREIRSLGDAILAGAGTVAADTMTMGLSDKALQKSRLARGQSAEPLRVIISNSGKLDPAWKVFRYKSSPLAIFSTTRMKEALRQKLAGKCDLWLFEGPLVSLSAMLALLRSHYRVCKLVCEGGPTLFRSLIEAGCVDEIHLTWAPVIFGGKKAPSLTGLPGPFLASLARAKLRKMEVIGSECYLTYKVIAPAVAKPRSSATKSPSPGG